MSGLEFEEETTPPESPNSSESAASTQQTTSKNSGQGNLLFYDGRTGQVYKIWLLNFFMTIVTIGIYRFWGKTRLRKYVASSFSLDGDRFEYTGTGGELFKGFMKSIPILMMTYTPLLIAAYFGGEDAVWPMLFVFPIIFIIGVAQFAALRYRLSRTQWRGIRGFLDGSAIKYGIFTFYRMCINIVTLGIAKPFSDIAKHQYIVNGLYFGNVPVEFNGDVRPVMKTHIITLLLAIPTLGISRLWYGAAITRIKISGLSFGKMRLDSTVTGGGLLKHIFINMLIVMVTLGLGTPIVMQRNMKFFSQHTKVIGDLNTAEIMQAENQKITVGEGLDDAFDMDTGLM